MRSSIRETVRASRSRPGGVNVIDVTTPSIMARVPTTKTKRNRASWRRIRTAVPPRCGSCTSGSGARRRSPGPAPASRFPSYRTGKGHPAEACTGCTPRRAGPGPAAWHPDVRRPGVTRIRRPRTRTLPLPDPTGIDEGGEAQPGAEHRRWHPDLDIAQSEGVSAGGRHPHRIGIDVCRSRAALRRPRKSPGPARCARIRGRHSAHRRRIAGPAE